MSQRDDAFELPAALAITHQTHRIGQDNIKKEFIHMIDASNFSFIPR